LERRRCQEESVWNTREKVRGQKREPKMRGESRSLKECSLSSLHFFLLYGFFFLCVFFFSFAWEEEDVRRNRLKQKGRAGAWRKAPSLLYIFFFLWFFNFCLKRRRCHEKAFETKG
jgi:hypothetical protein